MKAVVLCLAAYSFDSTDNKYKHVDPAQVLDLADSVDDNAFDGGTFT